MNQVFLVTGSEACPRCTKKVKKKKEDRSGNIPLRSNKLEATDWILQGKIQGSVLFRQYYPEGGWGYLILLTYLLVNVLTDGFVLGSLVLTKPMTWIFHLTDYQLLFLWVCPVSVALLISPIATSFCKDRSCRLCAVLGGILLSLGALFMSFAKEYHQVLIR